LANGGHTMIKNGFLSIKIWINILGCVHYYYNI
jgi:hypothetical protein